MPSHNLVKFTEKLQDYTYYIQIACGIPCLMYSLHLPVSSETQRGEDDGHERYSVGTLTRQIPELCPAATIFITMVLVFLCIWIYPEQNVDSISSRSDQQTTACIRIPSVSRNRRTPKIGKRIEQEETSPIFANDFAQTSKFIRKEC